jgi:hypothetical protein
VTDTNVFQLSQPGTFADPLTEILRDGARALLAQAVDRRATSIGLWICGRRKAASPTNPQANKKHQRSGQMMCYQNRTT